MGIQDRDWYREHHREQRRKRVSVPSDPPSRSDADEWRAVRKSLWRSAVTGFAFYGFGMALIKLGRWLF